jgi:hypothetical protein
MAMSGRPGHGQLGSFNVSVLLGNGDGTFQAARYFAVGVAAHEKTRNFEPAQH